MFRTLILFTSFLVIPHLGYAQCSDDYHPSGSVSLGFASQYVNSTGIVLTDGPTSTANLFVTLPCNLYVNVWNAAGLTSSAGDETSLTFGWSKRFPSQWELAASITAFDVNTDPKNFFGELAFTGTKHFSVTEGRRASISLQAAPKWSGSEGLTGEVDTTIGFHYGWSITDTVRVGTSTSVTYDHGIDGTESGFLANLGADLSVDLSPSVTWLTGVNAVLPIDHLDGRQDQFVVKTGLTWKF